MSSSPPTTLGQYQIIREIARSNDIVYEAYDPLMNRRVAVKELAMPTGMTDAQKADRVSRFKREAQAAGTLNHPNIMTVYSFAEEAGRIFMALEYLDGHTLRNEIDTKGFLPIDRAVDIAIEVLEGLGHAHSKGVIHRDIKPDNIQILSNGEVKITDFGIARLTFQPNLTMDGQVFGTPSYMSPEQVVGREIDARSDLFSVAIVLYEMISGTKPFPGDSVVTITYSIMNKEPQQPSQATWSLWQVLSRALDKSPQLRYSSAADMIEALRDAQRQAKTGMMAAQPTANPYSAPQTPAFNPAAAYATPPPIPSQAATPPPFNPYAQAPSPYPTAYNPYQPQIAQQPYGYPGQQAQPGVYQTPYTTMAPPGPVPVYYPPPPRAPLIKPETWIFMRNLTLAIVVVGTLFAMVCFAISEASSALKSQGPMRKDREVALDISQIDNHRPIEEQVAQAQKLFGGLASVPLAQKKESARNLAVLYEEMGRECLASRNEIKAEKWFKDAVDLDTTNAKLHSDLGDLYQRQANNASTADEKVYLLIQSGQSWLNAQSQSASQADQNLYGTGASQAFTEVASLIPSIKPDRPQMREALNNALATAQAGSPVRQQIENLLEQVS